MKRFWARLQPGITAGAAWSVMILFIVMIVITGASYVLTSKAITRVQHAATQAQNNAASITQLCQAGNEFRAQQVSLWQFVIHLSPPPPHETAAAKKAREKALKVFTAYLETVFRARDCGTLAGGK